MVAGGADLQLDAAASFDPDSLAAPSPGLYNFTWACWRYVSMLPCFSSGSALGVAMVLPAVSTVFTVAFSTIVTLNNSESMTWQLTLQQVHIAPFLR